MTSPAPSRAGSDAFQGLTLSSHLLMCLSVFLAHILIFRMADLLLVKTGLIFADRFSLCHLAASLAAMAVLHLCSLAAFGPDDFRKAVGLTRPPLRWLAGSVAGGALLFGGYLALCGLLGHQPGGGYVHTLYSDSSLPLVLAVAFVLIVPLFEELLFRGFFMSVLLRGGLAPWVTILTTALAWTVLHGQYGPPDLAAIFVAGLILGRIRLDSGSLWPPIAMHMAVNAMFLVIAM